ncbi:hypothetical protein EDC04DRAFT_2888515 [Pisolithus marmoratus]|nr:hypothetical protein EDC04DRAFT_2888515 [Pisolithus marmoratus]
MGALIHYYDNNDPSATSSPEGTEGLSPTDPTADCPSLSSNMDETASIPTTSIPTMPIPDLSGPLANLKEESLLNSGLQQQPYNLCGVIQPLEWADVLMTAELTSRKEMLDLTLQIECKVLVMFDAQPNRVFSY